MSTPILPEPFTFEVTYPVSFVVITCNDDTDTLAKMIATLPLGCEVCVLSNGQASKDHSGLQPPQELVQDGRLWRVQHWYYDEFSFAEARNYAHDLATNDWVMWLDSDDRLAACHHETIKRVALESPLGAGCAFCGVSSYEPPITFDPNDRGVMSGAYQCRMYRRSTGATWIGDIHEQIYPNIQRAGFTHVQTGIVIIHSGYHTSAEARLMKMSRNIDMLIRLISKLVPEHPAYGLRAYYAASLESSLEFTRQLRAFIQQSKELKTHG